MPAPSNPVTVPVVERLPGETIIRLRHPNDTAVANEVFDRNARDAFWDPFLEVERQSGRDEKYYDLDNLEARVRAGFSEALRSYLETIASPAIITPEGQRRAATAAAIIVQARIRGYSSIELGLTLEPINKVVELFDGRFEYFVAFLSAYSPLALERSLHSGGWFMDWSSTSGQLTCEVVPAATLVAAFGESPTKSSSTQNAPTTADKARWAWIVSNTSLVVPTLIAAIYIYLILSRSHEREVALDKAYHELIQVQSELIRSAFGKAEKASAPSPVATPAPSGTASPQNP